MSEGYAAGHVRLARDDGSIIAGALLPTEHELWDASRRRLTVLLDPARIKRGLPGHQEAGYPLRPGEPFRLVVGDGFRDAQGLPLRASAERRYEVGGEERRHVDPASWELAVPPAGTCEPLQVTFGRPLDHGLLARCLHVRGPDSELVDGTAQIGPGEQSWQLVPRRAWASAVLTSSSSIPSWRTWPATRSAGSSTGTSPGPRTNRDRPGRSLSPSARADRPPRCLRIWLDGPPAGPSAVRGPLCRGSWLGYRGRSQPRRCCCLTGAPAGAEPQEMPPHHAPAALDQLLQASRRADDDKECLLAATPRGPAATVGPTMGQRGFSGHSKYRPQPASPGPQKKSGRRCRIEAEVFVAGVRGRREGRSQGEGNRDHETDDHHAGLRRWRDAG